VSRYFILDDDFSLAIYEGSDAADALTKFLADHTKWDPGAYKVAQFGDGTASVLWRGREYRAYEAVAA
jgi:hypothetical protein